MSALHICVFSASPFFLVISGLCLCRFLVMVGATGVSANPACVVFGYPGLSLSLLFLLALSWSHG
jgi:hypothetical protein